MQKTTNYISNLKSKLLQHLTAILSYLKGCALPKGFIRLANESSRHGPAVTKFSTAAISRRWLLGKLGADPSTIQTCNAATDLPFGIITDEASGSGQAVAVELLGATPGTVRAVAGCRILANKPVFPAPAGKVQVLPDTEGTYYQIGYAVTAAAADGSELEIVTCVPHPVVVTEVI